jgi:hypothetical protein
MSVESIRRGSRFLRRVQPGSISSRRDDAGSIGRVPVEASWRRETSPAWDHQAVCVRCPDLRLEPQRCGHTIGAEPPDNQTSQQQPFVASLLFALFRIAHRDPFTLNIADRESPKALPSMNRGSSMILHIADTKATQRFAILRLQFHSHE